MRIGRYLASIRNQFPIAAHEDFDSALAGDALAARRIANVAPRRFIAHVAFLAYAKRTPNPAYRELVKAAWRLGARSLLTEFWSPRTVRRMLERADFRRPASQRSITVYCPVVSSTREAAGELCWTRSRKSAVSEAVAVRPANPRILQATVLPSDVLFLGDDASDEVVMQRPPRRLVVQAVDRPADKRAALGA